MNATEEMAAGLLQYWALGRYRTQGVQGMPNQNAVTYLTDPDARQVYVDKLRPFIVRTLGFEPLPHFGPDNYQSEAVETPLDVSDPPEVATFVSLVADLRSDDRLPLLWTVLRLVGSHAPTHDRPFLKFLGCTTTLSAAMTLVECCYGEVPPAALENLLKEVEATSGNSMALDLLELINPQVSSMDWRANENFKDISLVAMLGFMSAFRREERERNHNTNDEAAEHDEDPEEDSVEEEEEDSVEDPPPPPSDFKPFTSKDVKKVFSEHYVGTRNQADKNYNSVVRLLERYMEMTNKEKVFLGPDGKVLVEYIRDDKFGYSTPASTNSSCVSPLRSLFTYMPEDMRKDFISEWHFDIVAGELKELNQYLNLRNIKKMEQQELTQKQSDNWVWWETLVAKCKDWIAKNPLPDVLKSTADFYKCRAHIIMYVCVLDHVPRRLEIFLTLLPSMIDLTEGRKNYWKDGKLVYQQYKTAWKYGEYVINTLSEEANLCFKKVIAYAEEAHAEGWWGPFLLHQNKTIDEFNSRGSQIFKDVFYSACGTEQSCNQLRIERIDFGNRTGLYRYLLDREREAKESGHSVYMQGTWYQKRVDMKFPEKIHFIDLEYDDDSILDDIPPPPKVVAEPEAPAMVVEAEEPSTVVESGTEDSAPGPYFRESIKRRKRKGKGPAEASNKKRSPTKSISETETDEMEIDDDIGQENQAPPSHVKKAKGKVPASSAPRSSKKGKTNTPTRLETLRTCLPECVRNEESTPTYDWGMALILCKERDAKDFANIDKDTLESWRKHLLTKKRMATLDRILKEMKAAGKLGPVLDWRTFQAWGRPDGNNITSLASQVVFDKWMQQHELWLKGEFQPLDF